MLFFFLNFHFPFITKIPWLQHSKLALINFKTGTIWRQMKNGHQAIYLLFNSFYFIMIIEFCSQFLEKKEKRKTFIKFKECTCMNFLSFLNQSILHFHFLKIQISQFSINNDNLCQWIHWSIDNSNHVLTKKEEKNQIQFQKKQKISSTLQTNIISYALDDYKYLTCSYLFWRKKSKKIFWSINRMKYHQWHTYIKNSIKVRYK